MPQRITTTAHQWMGATSVDLQPAQARMISERNRTWITYPGGIRVKVIESYCGNCGETWANALSDDGIARPCETTGGPHHWTGAALVPLDDQRALRAVQRFSTSFNTFSIDIVETYCSSCHRPYQDVAAIPCEAAVSNEHLRGGPIGVRAKRKHEHNCESVGCPGPGGGDARAPDQDDEDGNQVMLQAV